MGFGKSIGKFFKSAGKSIKNAAQSVGREIAKGGRAIVKGADSVIQTGKSAVTTVYKDAKGLVTGVGDIVKNNVNKLEQLGEKVIDKGGDTVSSLGKSLSMPLMIGLGIVAVGGGIYLMSGNRGNQRNQ